MLVSFQYNGNMKSRRDCIEQAYKECLNEMYVESYPSITLDEILQIQKEFPDRKLYEEHYLSNFKYREILNKYKNIYNIRDHWRENMNFIISLLKDGGGFKNTYTKEFGRGAEKVPTLDKLTPDAAKVIQVLEDYKNFYKPDYYETMFDSSIALGASPTSVAERVLEKNPTWRSDIKEITLSKLAHEDVAEEWWNTAFDIYSEFLLYFLDLDIYTEDFDTKEDFLGAVGSDLVCAIYNSAFITKDNVYPYAKVDYKHKNIEVKKDMEKDFKKIFEPYLWTVNDGKRMA